MLYSNVRIANKQGQEGLLQSMNLMRALRKAGLNQESQDRRAQQVRLQQLRATMDYLRL